MRFTYRPDQLCFTQFGSVWSFSYFPGGGGGGGGGWGKIEIKDHLSQAEAETGDELGKNHWYTTSPHNVGQQESEI